MIRAVKPESLLSMQYHGMHKLFAWSLLYVVFDICVADVLWYCGGAGGDDDDEEKGLTATSGKIKEDDLQDDVRSFILCA